jgi:hypothetical protein
VARSEETAVRDAIQRVALADRYYGYRPIAAQLRREGKAVNRKRGAAISDRSTRGSPLVASKAAIRVRTTARRAVRPAC